MALVSNLQELLAALSSGEPLIEITAHILSTGQINVLRDTVLRSSNTDVPFLIGKDDSYSGYLFRVQNGASLHLQNIILDGRKETHAAEDPAGRSLVSVTNGSLYLEDGAVLRNNRSYLEGGGVRVAGNDSDTNRLLLSGSTSITGCEARTNGGGIFFSPGSGGADRLEFSGPVSLTGNTAAYGGGLYYRSLLKNAGGTVTIPGPAAITGNTASAAGGGICFSGFREGGGVPSSLRLTDGAALSGNQAVHGAGVYFYCAAAGETLELSGGTAVTQNLAANNGGGICLIGASGTPELLMANMTLTDNTAGTGGGLYLLSDAGGTVRVENISVTGNYARNEASGSGGGFWIRNRSDQAETRLSVSDSTFSRNEAQAHAGGILFQTGASTFTALFRNSSFTGCTSGLDGGALLLGTDGGGKTDLTGCSFTANTAAHSGGALYLANTSEAGLVLLNLESVSVTGNRAGYEGGGLRLMSGSAFLETTLTGCGISENTAAGNSGGGIWNGGTNATLLLQQETTVDHNISEEGNGGGIYFNSENGTLTLKDQTRIVYNRADVRESAAGNHGGGISSVPGRILISDQTEIAFNSALKFGGGISSSELSHIFQTGGAIHDNNAGSQGGGVWNHAGSQFTWSGGEIYGNTAPQGNGIFNDSRFDTEGSRNFPNGIHISDRNAVVFLTNPLLDGSVLQLEQSGYVLPNTERAPIVVGEATPDYPVLSRSDAAAFRKPPAGFENWEILLSDDQTQILLVPIVPEEYTLRYCANDTCFCRAGKIPCPVSVTRGQSAVLSDCIPVRRCFIFTGWNTEPNGQGETYLPGSTITEITGDITLYAIWSCCHR